jgi:rhamnosyltransferase
MTTQKNNPFPIIGIVMATYNGERYLRAQVESLQQQTYPHWHLHIRDDGSKDGTVALAKTLCEEDPRITLVQDNLGNLGFNRNFYQLLAYSKEEYIAFCDQDDVWMPTKLEKSLKLLQLIETAEKKPALVHADAELVDSNLSMIKARFIGKRGNKKGINGILFANSVQGASAMINRSLADLAIPIQPKMPFDFHLALIASITGTRAFIDESLAKYRQHGNNAIGALAKKTAGDTPVAPQPAYTASFLAGVGVYQHLKQELGVLKPATEETTRSLREYCYLFESRNRFRKLLIYLKNRYPFSRKKDTLLLLRAILLNQDLQDIWVKHSGVKPN